MLLLLFDNGTIYRTVDVQYLPRPMRFGTHCDHDYFVTVVEWADGRCKTATILKTQDEPLFFDSQR